MKSAILTITDEVNVKISGLDLDARRTLVNRFKYDVPYARYLPAVRLGRWDGKVAFFALGGSTYVNLLPDIIEILEQLNYDIALDDQREYPTTFAFERVTDDTFAHTVWPPTHVNAGDAIRLRDYQVDIINAFLATPQCLQEVATGAGKTLITAALSHAVSPYGRSIIIMPNKSLVTQTEQDYVNLGLDTGVFFGDRKEFGRQHTICTWQSLNVLLKNTRNDRADITIGEFLEGVVCVIVDECFDGDTLVTTTAGKRPIKELVAGDKVINLCESTNTYKEDTIVKVHKNLTNSRSEKMLELTFDGGQVIRVTANHKFLTDIGWVRADKLTAEMEVIDINTYG